MDKFEGFFEKIKSTFAEQIVSQSLDDRFLFLEIKENAIKQVLSFCYHDESCLFDFLEGITACEEKKEGQANFEYSLTYHLFSTLLSHRINIRIRSNLEKIGSVSQIWSGSQVFEKEITELFGISFEGNKFKRDLLLDSSPSLIPLPTPTPPMRKEFVVS